MYPGVIKITRLFLTVLLLLLPPILLISYGGKYGSLIWESKPLMHGIFMVLGLVTIMGLAIISFKSVPLKSRNNRKLVHALCNTASLLFMIIGWSRIYQQKEADKEQHCLSVHSWLGVLTMVVFSLTYLSGAVLFNPYIKCIQTSWRIAAKPYHVSSGVGVTLLAGVTVSTGLYSYTDRYVPEIFKTEQTPALRLILSAGLFCALALYAVMFALFANKPAVGVQKPAGSQSVGQPAPSSVMVETGK